MIADYGGPILPDEPPTTITNLNPFALMPCVSVKLLFDRLMAHYGWTYSGDLKIDDYWLSYPYAQSFDTANDVKGAEFIAVKGSGEWLPLRL